MANIDYSPFWEEALRQIGHSFTEDGKESEFELWFKDKILYKDFQGNKITASVPSKYICDQIDIRGYKRIIQDKLLEISGQELELELVVIPKTTQNNRAESTRKESLKSPSVSSAGHSKNSESGYGQSAKAKNHPRLNSDYTFDNFVPGDASEFAFNAANAVASNPGTAYNPLLINGDVGLGKTHLMQAIGNKIHEKFKLNIIYVSAEDFTNEFIQSITERTQKEFKRKYRNADVLLIDDIHFFQNKDGTQEELFHTFNALYENKKQLVFTCDRPIAELKNITDRLKSRFKRGLNVDIQIPNYENRRAIINNKLNLKGKTLPPEIIDLIAQKIETNVRDLESCISTLTGYAELTEKQLTLEYVKKYLADSFMQETSPESIKIIQRVVADYFNISTNDLTGKKRNKNITLARQVAQYLSREMTECSTTEIGEEFGRDHSTVMHSCEKIENMIHFDSSLDEVLKILKKKIKEHKNE